MSKTWLVRCLKFVAFAAVAVAAVGAAVMVLWNALMPDLFGWHVIGFWQAVGLLVLCRILLGGLRGRWGPRMHWRGRMMERWEHMTEQERTQFRQGLRQGCAGSATMAEPKS